ncbi:MAG: methylenetetrahydrofolate reductase, partial [Rhodobiaceae bacterium]|nr:methylenetetrahydrofolate reductase [Rhodobiaceae bacterium]
GAGGSTRDRTLDTLSRIAAGTGLSVAGHLTCVDATRDQVDSVVRTYAENGISRIVALRGDPREGVGARYTPPENGYRTTAELVASIARQGSFDISVSAYPEKHPESPDFDADLDVLKAKAEAGATRALTQFFFDMPAFYRYRDRVAARGIGIPIVPGIMPIVGIAQISRFASACGTTIPDWLKERFAAAGDDPARQYETSAQVAAEQVIELYDNGVREFHVYTMNRSDLTLHVCRTLNAHVAGEPVRPAAA